MKPVHNYRIPINLQFTIKPTAFKPKKSPISNNKKLTKLLYCVAKNTEEGWKAFVNTRGLNGYDNITILDFTEKSFELKGRKEVFLKHKDKTNHWVRIIRSHNTDITPGSSEVFCTLCDNDCFSGYIVKINGNLQFDMFNYIGMAVYCNAQLTKNNENKRKDE